MTLDRYMDTFGDDLARAGRARVRRRRRVRLAVAVPAAAALAVAAVALPGADDGDAVAAAREALAPADEIVHLKVQVRMGEDAIGPTTEQWYGGDPARWRMVQYFEAPKPKPARSAPAVVSSEVAFADDRIRVYDRNRDVVTTLEGAKPLKPLGPGILGGDPSTDVRAMLAAGDVRDDGVVTYGGRPVRRLVSDGQKRRLVYYMDPQTFAPVGGRMYAGRKAVFEFVVQTYERLPLNNETAKLLTFTETPNTKHERRTFRTR